MENDSLGRSSSPLRHPLGGRARASSGPVARTYRGSSRGWATRVTGRRLPAELLPPVGGSPVGRPRTAPATVCSAAAGSRRCGGGRWRRPCAAGECSNYLAGRSIWRYPRAMTPSGVLAPRLSTVHGVRCEPGSSTWVPAVVATRCCECSAAVLSVLISTAAGRRRTEPGRHEARGVPHRSRGAVIWRVHAG
jgi:hypothetical protein